MAPVVHDEACALDKDAVAARVLADEVGHHAAKRRLDHLDFLVGAWRHGLQSRVGLARRKRVLNFTSSLLPLVVRRARRDKLFSALLRGSGLAHGELLLARVVLGRCWHCGHVCLENNWLLFLLLHIFNSLLVVLLCFCLGMEFLH